MKKTNSFSALPLMLSVPFLFQGGFSMPWWGWVLLFIVIIAVVLILIRSGDNKDTEMEQEPEPMMESDLPLVDIEPEEPLYPMRTMPAVDIAEPVAADDLTIIEGIGPRISEFLNRNGITTFRELADMDMAQLDQMLADANFGIANPDTWARQADLAAQGKWDELKELQDSLRGGRMVG